ncbi:cyclic pyranopterin monophosphate synthase MoaC [Pacificimonas flava]|uniref:Cyclic pyranopterin monophosphate synthase n=2 Tax=Pacificimonas TaxID=1960290 RepID=A0A219B6W4_9SPHN|nr:MULTISPECIES: cyclic pyranopterin monophosphate synthase MoaC [Pacificimonas]MBZ6378620.1 cyclic pyranopterin monophosphate synthase MoaC [Pacificimonas aurantium]OWV34105.1 cyclic pyranopterin monophosphate synthase MoaC [Pacificimonas flava]
MPLTHLDESGAARMVDISGKPATKRAAVAGGRVVMSAEARQAIADGTIPKGDVIAAARIAAIQAAKKTADIIPLCHPLPLTGMAVDFRLAETGVEVTAEVSTTFGTGVEMEALTAVTAACLTIYDMAKAIDKAMRIEGIRLLRKTGGKSGDWSADDAPD